MNAAIALGPLLIPVALLVVLASAGVALAVGKWLSKDAAAEVDRVLWQALLAGLLLARLSFVYEYRALYLSSPLSILDVRDGGWNPSAGLIGAWLVLLYRGHGAPKLRRPLRWAASAGTALFLVGTALLAVQPASRQPLPPLAFMSLDGEPLRLDSFKGRPTVVNLWATWCPPCVREMPVLQQAQARRPDVHFVFLNQGETPADVARWLASRELVLRNVLVDPKRQASATFHQMGYPTTLFFDAEGRLVSTRLGELSAATLGERLERLTKP